MKPPYLLAKNSHDVLNVHNLWLLRTTHFPVTVVVKESET